MTISKLILSLPVALALTACGGGSHDDIVHPTPTPGVPAPTPGDVFALTVSSKLVSFDRATPGTVRTSVARSESTPWMPILAKIAVKAAKTAERSAQ